MPQNRTCAIVQVFHKNMKYTSNSQQILKKCEAYFIFSRLAKGASDITSLRLLTSWYTPRPNVTTKRRQLCTTWFNHVSTFVELFERLVQFVGGDKACQNLSFLARFRHSSSRGSPSPSDISHKWNLRLHRDWLHVEKLTDVYDNSWSQVFFHQQKVGVFKHTIPGKQKKLQ